MKCDKCQTDTSEFVEVRDEFCVFSGDIMLPFNLQTIGGEPNTPAKLCPSCFLGMFPDQFIEQAIKNMMPLSTDAGEIIVPELGTSIEEVERNYRKKGKLAELGKRSAYRYKIGSLSDKSAEELKKEFDRKVIEDIKNP